MRNGHCGYPKARPKIRTSSGYRAGLTAKEINAWIDRVSLVRAARDKMLFCPEFRRWHGAS